MLLFRQHQCILHFNKRPTFVSHLQTNDHKFGTKVNNVDHRYGCGKSNIFVLFRRLFMKTGNKVPNALIVNLASSDFLMGIQILILTSSDMYYADYFPSFSNRWIKEPLCQVAAVLATLSSELSVCFVTLIGFDRYLATRYPLGIHRGFGSTRANISICLTWVISILISVGPTVLNWYIPDIDDISEVCVGLPIIKRVVTSTENDIK